MAAPYSIYDRYITKTESGKTIPSASVYVTLPNGTPAQLYANRLGTATVDYPSGLKPNPFTADADGRVVFYINHGRYNIEATSPEDGTINYYDVLVAPEDPLRASDIVGEVATVATFDSLATTPALTVGQIVYMYGPGSGHFQDSAGTLTNDGGTIINNTITAARHWKRIRPNSNEVELAWFRPSYSGSADNLSKLIAAYNACPSGGTLRIEAGKTLTIGGTFVLNRQVDIVCGNKEATFIKGISGSSYLAAPYKAVIVALHSSTVVAGYSGDARRSKLEGFTITVDAAVTSCKGLLKCTPITVINVDTKNCTSDGHVTAASSAVNAPTEGGFIGNANGCVTIDCISQLNNGYGFYQKGTDSNASTFLGCKAPQNTGWGFYDDGFLGNNYVGCETDANGSGGFFENKTKPIASTYSGCYGEGNQPNAISPVVWDINIRSVRIGCQGLAETSNAVGKGNMLQPLPNNGMYHNRPSTYADNGDIADANGGGAFPGSMMRIDQRGFLYRHISGKLTFAMQSGGQGIDFYYGTNRSFVIPDADLGSTNVKTASPWFPMGITVGGAGLAGIDAGTAIPASGTYQQGHIRFNTTAVASGFIGWVCISSGSPGTWKTFGAISA